MMQEMAQEGTAEMDAAHGCGQSGAAVTRAAPKSCARAEPAARRRVVVRWVVEERMVNECVCRGHGGHTMELSCVVGVQLRDGREG